MKQQNSKFCVPQKGIEGSNPSLSVFKKPRKGIFYYTENGAVQTALHCVGMRSPQRCFCFSVLMPRKAKTARAGPGKIPVREFMQGESLPLRI